MLERVEHLKGARDRGVTSRSGQVGHGAYSTGVVFESWVVEAHGLRSLLVQKNPFGRRPSAVCVRPAERGMVAEISLGNLTIP
jgi:hypothetical protein